MIDHILLLLAGTALLFHVLIVSYTGITNNGWSTDFRKSHRSLTNSSVELSSSSTCTVISALIVTPPAPPRAP
ncbi:hypothetical protein BDW75DRAFT_211374 [Aspergillus navahoensis]